MGPKKNLASKMAEPFQEISEIRFPSPMKTGFGIMASKMNVNTPDNYSMQEGSNIFQDEEEHGGHVEACPMSSVPGINTEGSEVAWRSAVLPFLTTTPDLAVWEVSERYTSWLSACNIKLGVTGAASQTFFLVLLN